MSIGLTINGIDGFLSGNWTLHANAKVIDDETLELNATAMNQQSYAYFNVLGNTKYNFSLDSIQTNGWVEISFYDSTATRISYSNYTVVPISITTPSNTVQIRFNFSSSTAGTFTFKRPIINLGDIPAPYEKKRGDRMVLPVPKKNLFDGRYDSGFIYANSTSETLSAHATARTSKWIHCKPNTTYTLNGGNRSNWQVRNISGVISFIADSIPTATTLSDSSEMRVYYTVDGLQNELQIEEGTVATPYEPYAVQINQKSARRTPTDSGVLSAVRTKLSSGLSFNGNTDYLQLPNMTMDSVEIDCFIDSVQPNVNFKILDARIGLVNGWVADGSVFGSNWQTVTGFVQNSKTKVKMNSKLVFTDDINIFSNYQGMEQMKGILYKVTCYLNGEIVAQYDFEKQNTDVSSLLRGNPIWLLKQAVR